MVDDIVGHVRAHVSAALASCGRGAVGGLLLWQLLAAVTEGLALVLLLPVVQAIGGSAAPRLPLAGFTMSASVAFALLVAAVVLRAAAQWGATVKGTEVRMLTTDHVRLTALSALFDAEWRFVLAQRRSHLVQQLTTEVFRTGTAIELLTRAAVGCLAFVATAIAAVTVAPVPGLLAVAAVLMMALASRTTLVRASRLGVSLSDRVATFGATVTDSLASIRLIRAHDSAAPWTRQMAEDAEHSREVQRRYVRSSAGLRAVFGVAGAAVAVGLVLLGRDLGLDAAELVVLAVAASRLLTSGQQLVTQTQQFANLAPALERITTLTTEARAHQEADGGPVSSPAPSSSDGPLVELRGISVRHEPERPLALEGVDLVLPGRGLTVLSGPSGAGKSTLLDVLLGLISPDEGEVLVDGAPLVDRRAWRARLGYLPQQIVLVPGTVLTNLAWSAGRKVGDDEAWAALEEACLADVVRALPRGLQSPLREFTELSGGEQQRLCLARALVRRPGLLLLDEATSSLDPDTESRVLDRLAHSDRSVLLVTHREAPLRRASQVLRLAEGRLVPS